MQTMLSIVLIGVLIAVGLWRRSSKPIIGFAAIGAGCLLSLFLGLFILYTNGLTEPVWTVGLIGLCGLIWGAVGIIARIGILHLCGHCALLLSYVWLIRQLHPDPSWWTLQLYAVPLGGLLYWAGASLNKGVRSAGFILLVASCLYWLIPEGYGFIFTDISGMLLQLAFVTKLILAGLFGWRYWNKKKYTAEWLSDHD